MTDDSPRWRYSEPTSETDSTPVVIEMSERQILDTYFAYWCGEMRRVGKAAEISERECINDWVVVHWAEPVERS